jgi:opine dehydrogenase
MIMGQDLGVVQRIAVLSAGNGGITFAAHFLESGIEWVSLYNRSRERLDPIRSNNNRIFSRGIIGGEEGTEMELALVTGNPVKAIQGVDFIIMAGTQPAIDYLGQELAPYIHPHQVMMIGSGTLGSTWEMQASLKAGGCKDLPVVGEFNILPYATKLDSQQQGRVWVRGVKSALDAAFSPLEDLEQGKKEWLLSIYPYLDILPDVLYTGLSGANMVVHPVVVLRNQEKVRRGEPWALYAEGVTPQVGELMDAVDAERMAIARACNIEMVPIYKFLIQAYEPFDDASPSNMYEWFRSRMRSEAGQVHLEAVPGPLSFNVRLLEEDIPYGMVPLEGLGKLLGVNTPHVTTLIDEACDLLDVDFRTTGRTISKMEDEVKKSLASLGVNLDG